jgi:hypothetical protein
MKFRRVVFMAMSQINALRAPGQIKNSYQSIDSRYFFACRSSFQQAIWSRGRRRYWIPAGDPHHSTATYSDAFGCRRAD